MTKWDDTYWQKSISLGFDKEKKNRIINFNDACS